MRPAPECERGNHRCHFRPDVVRRDQELRLEDARAKRITEPAATAIPRHPAIARGFAFMGHGSCLPGDQRVQTIRRDDGATADAPRQQAARCNVGIDGGPTQAGSPAGFLDAVGEPWRIVLDGLHFFGPTLRKAGHLRFVGDQLGQIRLALDGGTAAYRGDCESPPSHRCAIMRSIYRVSLGFPVFGLGGNSATIDAAADPIEIPD